MRLEPNLWGDANSCALARRASHTIKLFYKSRKLINQYFLKLYVLLPLRYPAIVREYCCCTIIGYVNFRCRGSDWHFSPHLRKIVLILVCRSSSFRTSINLEWVLCCASLSMRPFMTIFQIFKHALVFKYLDKFGCTWAFAFCLNAHYLFK